MWPADDGPAGPDDLASMSAMPALISAGGGAGVVAGAHPGGSGRRLIEIASWLKAGISQVGLAALTRRSDPRRPFLPSAFDDAEDSKPYVLAQPLANEPRGRVRVQDNALVRGWRRQLGKIQKLFRSMNQVAYVASLPFLMILIVGAALKNRPLALFGATLGVDQYCEACRRGHQPGRHPAPRRDQTGQDEEATAACDRAGPHHWTGRCRFHIHPLALQRSVRQGKYCRPHSHQHTGPREGDERRGQQGRRRRQARRHRQKETEELGDNAKNLNAAK